MIFYLSQPATLLGVALALVLGVLAHDAAQVLAAQVLGDPAARRSGRLTLRPKPHVSVYSVIAMVIGGVGWAEPVPMNDRWRARRFRIAAAVLAGPLAYLVLCVASLAALRGVATHTVIDPTVDRVVRVVHAGAATDILFAMALTFASLCVLSLVPVPPLDGGRVLFALGPTSPSWGNARYTLEERNIGLAIVLAVILLPVLLSGFPTVVGQLVADLLPPLQRLVGL